MALNNIYASSFKENQYRSLIFSNHEK